MLDNLLEIELAYSLMKTNDKSYEDPIDVHFAKLNTDIQVSTFDIDFIKLSILCYFMLHSYGRLASYPKKTY